MRHAHGASACTVADAAGSRCRTHKCEATCAGVRYAAPRDVRLTAQWRPSARGGLGARGTQRPAVIECRFHTWAAIMKVRGGSLGTAEAAGTEVFAGSCKSAAAYLRSQSCHTRFHNAKSGSGRGARGPERVPHSIENFNVQINYQYCDTL